MPASIALQDFVQSTIWNNSANISPNGDDRIPWNEVLISVSALFRPDSTLETMILHNKGKIYPKIENVIFSIRRSFLHGRISGQMRERWISTASLLAVLSTRQFAFAR
jgi:hypothetical protein